MHAGLAAESATAESAEAAPKTRAPLVVDKAHAAFPELKLAGQTPAVAAETEHSLVQAPAAAHSALAQRSLLHGVSAKQQTSPTAH